MAPSSSTTPFKTDIHVFFYSNSLFRKILFCVLQLICMIPFGLTHLKVAIAWLFQSSKSNIFFLMSLTVPEPHQFSTTLMAVLSLAVRIPATSS